MTQQVGGGKESGVGWILVFMEALTKLSRGSAALTRGGILCVDSLEPRYFLFSLILTELFHFTAT